MATALRLSASALRASTAASAASPLRSAAFNGLRAYSTGKTQVELNADRLRKVSTLLIHFPAIERDLRCKDPRECGEDQEAPKVRERRLTFVQHRYLELPSGWDMGLSQPLLHHLLLMPLEYMFMIIFWTGLKLTKPIVGSTATSRSVK